MTKKISLNSKVDYDAFLFHLPCKSETVRNLNFEDEDPTKGDLRYEVGNLRTQLRDIDEQIAELKQQIPRQMKRRSYGDNENLSD